MEYFFTGVLAILFIILWRFAVTTKRRLDFLEKSLRDAGIAVPVYVPVKKAARKKAPSAVPEIAVAHKTGPEPVPKKAAPEPKKPEPAAPREEQRPAVPKPESAASVLWKKVEKQFIENWTGIVGAVFLVLGIAFLAVIAALRMTAEVRFAMILGIAALLMAAYAYLRKKEGWLRIAAILRSVAGALVLFACLGAGVIPGLKFIESESIILAVIGAGVAFNLFLGFIGPAQVFASFHVLISIVALSAAPKTPVTLVIVGIVVLLGVVMSYRNPWQYHLLLTLAGYFFYHIYWYRVYVEPSGLALYSLPRLTGIIVTAVIGIAACLVHYRKAYADKVFSVLPFIVHLSNWFFMGISFVFYATGSKWNTVILAAAGLAAFALSRRAKFLSIRWLKVTDTLVAQAMLIIAIFTLKRWGAESLLVTGVLYLEVFIFLALMVLEKDRVLRTVGVVLHYLSLAVFAINALGILDYDDLGAMAVNSIAIAVAILLESAFHVYSVRHADERIDSVNMIKRGTGSLDLSVGGIFIGALGMALAVYLHRYMWSGAVIAALLVALILLRQRIQSAGLWAGILLFAACAHFITWGWMNSLGAEKFLFTAVEGAPMAEMPLSLLVGRPALYGAALFAASLALMRFSLFDFFKKHIAWPGVYLFTLHFVLYAYFIAKPVSPFIPAVAWLTASLLYLELATRMNAVDQTPGSLRAALSRHFIMSGYALIALFAARHVMVHLQSELIIDFIYGIEIKLRLLIEVYAVLVLAFWATASIPKKGISEKIEKIHPAVWEALILFVLMTVALEVPSAWHPLAWALLAYALYCLGLIRESALSRFRFYSILLFWTAAFYVAVISGSTPTPSARWADQPWICGIITLALLLGYTIMYYRTKGLDGAAYPWNVKAVNGLIAAIHRRRNIWIFYPLFIAAALFCYWSFDRAILTLLWVAEAFSIFILSLALRESHFRFVSMGALGLLVIRIIFYDLSRSGTITRALVFIGSGALMLLVNILYNKYRGRFEK